MKTVSFEKEQTILYNARNKNMDHHAYGIVGPNHVECIFELIAHTICSKKEQFACMDCTQCISFQKGLHPDVFFQDQRVPLTIDEMRRLQKKMHSTPQYSDMMIFAFAHADLFTRETEQSFLKILEEPPKNRLFFLGVKNEYLLKETIRSRLQLIRLSSERKKEKIQESDEKSFWRDFLQESIEKRPHMTESLFSKKKDAKEYKKKLEYGILFLQEILHSELLHCDDSEKKFVAKKLSLLEKAQKQLQQNGNSKMILDLLIISL